MELPLLKLSRWFWWTYNFKSLVLRTNERLYRYHCGWSLMTWNLSQVVSLISQCSAVFNFQKHWMPIIPCVNLVWRERRDLRPDLGHRRCWDKANPRLAFTWMLRMSGWWGPQQDPVSFWVFSAQLRTSCHSVVFYPLVLCLCHTHIFLGPLWVAVVISHPHVFPGSLVINHLLEPQCHHFFLFLCLPPTRIWELYKGRPTVSGFCFFQCSAQNWPQRRYLKNYLFIRN